MWKKFLLAVIAATTVSGSLMAKELKDLTKRADNNLSTLLNSIFSILAISRSYNRLF